mmetsp:Transcript_25459/g.52997  ORF Transcript_25459/g.52997 Transcript_25459/m.52997 type:complete len:108 (+) Transcript_25459:200-523(+)
MELYKKSGTWAADSWFGTTETFGWNSRTKNKFIRKVQHSFEIRKSVRLRKSIAERCKTGRMTLLAEMENGGRLILMKRAFLVLVHRSKYVDYDAVFVYDYAKVWNGD